MAIEPPLPVPEQKNSVLRKMEAILKVFSAKTDEEQEEDREEEERKARVEAYLESLDPKQRQFEEKKMNAYKVQGKIYHLPDEV